MPSFTLTAPLLKTFWRIVEFWNQGQIENTIWGEVNFKIRVIGEGPDWPYVQPSEDSFCFYKMLIEVTQNVSSVSLSHLGYEDPQDDKIQITILDEVSFLVDGSFN